MNAEVELLVNKLLNKGMTYEEATAETTALYNTAYLKGLADSRGINRPDGRIDSENPIKELHQGQTRDNRRDLPDIKGE